jgi:predicted transposase/invertase (TIGR01784 family)
MAKIPDNADILPPSDDRIFKVLLTHRNGEPVLRSVVSTVIERPVVSVQVVNNELPISDVEEKAQRLDVNCIVDGGDQINVEMQSSPMEEAAGDDKRHTNFRNRFTYYTTALHSSQKSKGVQYYELARSFQVTFCGYTLFPKRSGFVNRIALRWPDGEQFSDQINMVIVEMSKLAGIQNKPVETLTPIEMWSAFFMFAPQEEYRNLINNIISIKEEIGMASALLMEISKDDHERALFMSRKKAEMDLFSNLRTAETRGETRGRTLGRTEGIALGRTEGMNEVFALMDKGLSATEIKKMLGIAGEK